MRQAKPLLVGSILTALAACGQDPPTPSETRQRIADDLGHVLHEASGASEMSHMLPTALATRLLGGSPAEEDPMPMDGFDGDAAVKWLNDNLFTDANYAGDGIYRVPASLVCSTTTIDDNGNETTSIDSDCAKKLDAAQVRVRVEADGDALRFSLQVDADHDEPISVLLAHDAVAATLDLDSSGRAIVALAPVFGEQAPNVRLAGRVTASLHALGPSHASVALDIDRALSIAYADGTIDLDGPDAFRFASAAAHVIDVELDGTADRALVDLALGATSAHLPGDEFDPATTDLDLPGATANASFDGGLLVVENISLGTRTTKLLKNGIPAVSIDLNPEDGRKLTAMINVDDAGREIMSVSPALDLRTTTDHAALGDERGVYDVTRVLLHGVLASDGGETIKVMSGSFSIATDPASYGFSATAGQCVTSSDASDANGNFYTAYSVAACL